MFSNCQNFKKGTLIAIIAQKNTSFKQIHQRTSKLEAVDSVVQAGPENLYYMSFVLDGSIQSDSANSNFEKLYNLEVPCQSASPANRTKLEKTKPGINWQLVSAILWRLWESFLNSETLRA